jgi:hypothetical protein
MVAEARLLPRGLMIDEVVAGADVVITGSAD